jgi:hypothetical protein
MPTLEELFKNKVITEGPNTGKTAEDAYSIRNSKDLPVQSSNFLLRAINKNTNPSLLGGVINSFDFIGKINERRKKFSVREGESFVEQEQVGLQQFAITQPNIAVQYFPFNWLPSVVVPLVLFSHLASIQQLLNR